MAIRVVIYAYFTMLLPPTVFATQLYRSYWFTPSQQQQIIDSHNELRRLEPAADMQELVWDDALAALAKDHASKCDAWHRDASERRGHGYRYIGENIWWSTEPFLRHDLKSVIRDFYNEKPFYDFNSLWCRPGEMCGHYTQVVWADTCAVGCGASHCDGIINGRGIHRGHIITCNYGEGGNSPRQPYTVGPHCSHCPGPCTREGLCASKCSGRSFSAIYSRLTPHETKGSKEDNNVVESREEISREEVVPLTQPPNRPAPRRMWIRPETADNTCQDYVRDCVAWRNMGECERNRGYMIQYCRQACNFCRRDNIPLTAPTPTLPPLTLPPPTLPPPTKQSPSPKLPKKAQKNPKIEQKDTNCVDRHSLCSFWSTLNACATNSVYMQENCFMSCNRNICHEGVILLPASECVDKNADCGYWAAVGECERNSFFMNWKCPKACSHCTLDQ